MPKTPEGEVRKWFLKELRKAIPHVFVQINYQSRYTKKGKLDLTISANGKVVWVELKAASGETTPHQEKTIKEIRQAGCVATVLKGYDVQKLTAIVKYLQN